MDMKMTVVNQLITLLCPKLNPQGRKCVSLPGSLFRVITGEITHHSLHKGSAPDPVRNSDEIYRYPQ